MTDDSGSPWNNAV